MIYALVLSFLLRDFMASSSRGGVFLIAWGCGEFVAFALRRGVPTATAVFREPTTVKLMVGDIDVDFFLFN